MNENSEKISEKEANATENGVQATPALLDWCKRPDAAKWAFFGVMGVFAGLILPYLGTIGFYDPWETHYGEVARQMVVRDDYLYPFWKNAYFFSKPVLLFWVTAIPYKIIGAGVLQGPLPDAVEWAARLPIALFSLSAAATLFWTVYRFWKLPAAILSSLVLATTPFWFFMSKQAITDMLFVAPSSMAVCFLALTFFDDKERWKHAKLPVWLIGIFALFLLPQLWEIGRTAVFFRRYAMFNLPETESRLIFSLLLSGGGALFLGALKRWGRDPMLHSACFCLALATLAKGPLGLGVVGLVFLTYWALTGEWKQLKHAGLLTGILLFLAVAAPWYTVMWLFEGKDEERRTWYKRFIEHDLLKRATKGVHGDKGNSTYYFSYFSWGFFPWSALFPVAFLKAIMRPWRFAQTTDPSERFLRLVGLWALMQMVFFTAVTTKFHHYIFPVVVPAALLVGFMLSEWLEQKEKVSLGLITAVVLGTLIIGRDLVKAPWELADLFTYHYKNYKPDYYFPKDIPWGEWVQVVLFSVLICTVLGVLFDRFGSMEKAESGFVAFIQKLLSPLTELIQFLRMLFTGNPQTPNGATVAGFVVAGLIFGVFGSQVYFNRLAQHWGHKYLIDTYYEQREPGEPLIAYQMNWRGETFYSANQDDQAKKNAQFKKSIKKPGRKFVLTETKRLKNLKSVLGKEGQKKMKIINRSSKKWYLVLLEE